MAVFYCFLNGEVNIQIHTFSPELDATYSVGRCVEIWAPVCIFG